MPEPDFVVMAAPLERYLDRRPGAHDVHLAIEVSDTPVSFDRGAKLRAYARNGIREYWIVNLQAHVVEVYRDPAGPVYGTKRTLGRGETIAPLAFPEFEVETDDFLPPAD